MSTIVSRLDIIQIFYDVDDFCSSWQRWWQQVPQQGLPQATAEAQRSQCVGRVSRLEATGVTQRKYDCW
ncbi:MAG: hypothetical protein V7K46_15230 [Nostoc sp.]